MKSNLNGVIYYYEWFSGYCPERPTILCLHGFTGTSQTFAGSFTTKFSKHYNLLAVDLLGHGQTQVFVHPYRYQMDCLCKDLVALTDELGLSSFSLIGYSMGARVALALTLLFPGKIDRVLLEGGSPGLQGSFARAQRQRMDQQLAIRLLSQGIRPFVDSWEQAPLFATQKQLPRALQMKIRKERLSQQPLGLACSLWYMGTGVQPDFWSNLSDLQPAVTLVVGEYDHKFIEIAKQMKQRQPKLTIIIVPDAGHCVHLEKPTEFLSVLQTVFLKE